jgi:tetratricopeptide (TPR) repeat protein
LIKTFTLKAQTIKNIFSFILLLAFLSCSTKKNSLVNRNWHALNSQYNTLYNGDVALDKAISGLKTTYSDNYWQTLPVERMQVSDEQLLPGQKTKNQDFDRAETKAIKAIQKHSMNIQGNEKNMQMDEAHLLLGKARYYDQRFIPALEAFNYILYKYANSDKIYEAKVWREKTNIRLENEAIAVKNLKKLIKNNKIKPQILADANAILSQAYINLEQKDSAVAPLKEAISNTKLKEERARYRFILGQVYQSLTYKDSAYNSFQEVIEMNRKSPRVYVIQAHAKQTELVDNQKDTTAFFKKFDKLLADRENRPFLDVLNYQKALLYDQLNLKQKAITFYNVSLKAKTTDNYLQANTYKNLATIYFDKAKYQMAGQYYDSTLTKLIVKNREYFAIQKKRQNLEDVIKYEEIAQKSDSIINICSLSKTDQKSYFDDYISKLKAKDIALKAKEEKQKASKANATSNNIIQSGELLIESKKGISKQEPSKTAPPASTQTNSVPKGSFYFYNSTTVSYGKLEFEKRWGKRKLADNWRLSNQTDNNNSPTTVDPDKPTSAIAQENEKYNSEYYIKLLPKSQKVLDSLAKDRNFALYQLGVVYKEKFNETKLATEKFETLLENKPEERLVLPAMYNLYKIYEKSNPTKAEEIKNKITANYPNTRYAQILSGKSQDQDQVLKSPAETYNDVYKTYLKEDYNVASSTIENALVKFSGDNIIPKFELLKASISGKQKGVEEYKKAINYVALTYPNTEEGKQAEDILKIMIPKLEKLKFENDSLSKNWKILYSAGKPDDYETKTLIEKLNKYIVSNKNENYKVSYDKYTETNNFVVVHGITFKDNAAYFIENIKNNIEYQVSNTSTIISTDNYSVLQIKKNYNQYIEFKK